MSQHHDPVHPDSEHLTAEVLADLDLGLLDAASTSHARHHLTHCRPCAQLRDDLATVTATLAELPPVPMPDSVWERLSEAVAAEPVVTPEGAATVVPLAGGRQRRSWRPGIGLVAGAAGVALIGAIVVPILNDSGSSDLSGGDGSVASGDRAPAESASVPPVAYVASRTGTDYQPEALERQATSLVASRSAFTATATLPPEPSTGPSPEDTAAPPSGTPSASPSGTPLDSASADVVLKLTAGPAAAQACLESYLDAPGIMPLAIDIGTWDGRPAAVIVLPDDVDPTVAEVWVIDPDCAGPEDPLLYFATISR
jgi:cell division septation protein DedD